MITHSPGLPSAIKYAPKRLHRLGCFFSPRTVAVVGASQKHGSIGRALLENLQTFPGRIFPVNLRHDCILGRQSYRSLAAIPELIDLAIIAVPAPAVPGVIRECVQSGVSGAIVISAGFRECGSAGRILEEQVLAEAKRSTLRLIGPNCLGVSSPHAGLNATFASTAALPGHIAFVSQSGALCSAVLDWSRGENVGFSAFVSIGAMLDVNWSDLLGHFRDDPRTRVILLYMESVCDPAFLIAARRVALTKPIIVLKVGRTAEAAAAAASHTGALIGSDKVFDAALQRAGILRVDSVRELFDAAEILSSQKPPAGSRLTIVTNAGGPGALATDELVLGGGQAARLTQDLIVKLDAVLPPQWSRGNPVDILGDADPARFSKAVEIVVRDPQADGLLVILTPQTMTNPSATATQVAAVGKKCSKPFFSCWMGGDRVNDGRAIFRAEGIPTFEYPEEAARAFCQLARLGELQRSLAHSQEEEESMKPSLVANAQCTTVIAEAKASGRLVLSEFESKQFLSLEGIPSVETRLATTIEAAITAADDLGYPVVLKLHSHTITHKSEVGGVQLNLRDAASVRGAWHLIRETVTEKKGGAHFLGVTVQPMVVVDGREIILGSSLDPQFGPVLLFGAGGRLVEIFKDYALDLPPLNPKLAQRLMERTKIFAALQGARGQAPVDLVQLTKLMANFSRVVLAYEDIESIDLNPLVVQDGRLIALDARIILRAAKPKGLPSGGPALLYRDDWFD